MIQQSVYCPSCGEEFSISEVAPEDFGQVIDYDCEVCCRPMVIEIDEEGELFARSLDD